MLEVQPIEFLLRAIPEGFLYIFGVYIFSQTKIDKKKYIIASLITSVATYFIRLLPINYGVHTILIILFIIFLVIIYNKIDSIQSIKSIIINFIIQFLSEGINIVILTSIPGLNLEELFNDAVPKMLLGIPSLIITFIMIIIIKNIYKKRDEIKDV